MSSSSSSSSSYPSRSPQQQALLEDRAQRSRSAGKEDFVGSARSCAALWTSSATEPLVRRVGPPPRCRQVHLTRSRPRRRSPMCRPRPSLPARTWSSGARAPSALAERGSRGAADSSFSSVGLFLVVHDKKESFRCGAVRRAMRTELRLSPRIRSCRREFCRNRPGEVVLAAAAAAA